MKRKLKIIVSIVVAAIFFSPNVNASFDNAGAGQEAYEEMHRKIPEITQAWSKIGPNSSEEDIKKAFEGIGYTFSDHFLVSTFKSEDPQFGELSLWIGQTALSFEGTHNKLLEAGYYKDLVGDVTVFYEFTKEAGYERGVMWNANSTTFHLMLNNPLSENPLPRNIESEDEMAIEGKPEISMEINPSTGKVYQGVLCGEGNELQITLHFPDGFDGKVNIKSPQQGKIEGVETDKNIIAKSALVFKYVPPLYMSKNQGLTENETIVVRYMSKEESGELSQAIELHRIPVVLVHGFTGDASTWSDLDDYLQDMGYSTVRKDYYYDYSGGQGIPAQAEGLSRDIKEKLQEYSNRDIKANKVDIVAHSMGGLISRYYISSAGSLYQDDVNKLIMVGTPNHGCNDLDQRIGKLMSNLLDIHKQAAEELFSKSSLILDLNKGEAEGKHLNPSIQYGIIYGMGSILGGDGIVSDASALLNGVHNVSFWGRTHSPALNSWGSPLTTDRDVFLQISEWLSEDIPPGNFLNIEKQIYAVAGEAYLEKTEFLDSGDNWELLSDESVDLIDNFQEIKTGNGKVVLVLSVGNEIYGQVDLDKNTRLYFEYAAPHLIRVNLMAGSARFTSNGSSGRHFEVSLEANNAIQTVRGLGTQFVVSIAAQNRVSVLEGKAEILHISSSTQIEQKGVLAGEQVTWIEGGQIIASESNDEV
ncbi:MAG: alpha/beta fold hydrolase [Clostridia bacterium]|nr:alpha/beta fold hydrolase [Clostridia bacterium]